MFSRTRVLAQRWNIKWLKSNLPQVVESQKKRFANPSIPIQILDLDDQWRNHRGEIDLLNKNVRQISKLISTRSKNLNNNHDTAASSDQNNEYISLESLIKEYGDNIQVLFEQHMNKIENLTTNELKELSKYISGECISKITKQMNEFQERRDFLFREIGNIVDDSVPVHNNEDFNTILKVFDAPNMKLSDNKTLINHVDIMHKLQSLHTDKGAQVAGSRGYFLTGDLVRLNIALIHYSMDFLTQRGYTPILPPFFMDPSIAKEVAQLEQFEEELYVVSDGTPSHDRYLIATSEQPLCAFHRHEWLDPEKLPIKYVGTSTCFRKEAGSHGRDTLGIFRVHQFDKVEQFCITAPDESWNMMDEMISNSETFYKSLDISYRLVNIVSGKLNNAASKKIDLEAYFPASKTYRELVSCSNCTDYQSSRLKIHYGNAGSAIKEHVHMLNATLCATTRTMCCIVETHQCDEGIRIPEVLRPYGFHNQEFIPWRL